MPMTPNGFPVMLTFDLDAETMWTARDRKNAGRPVVLSQGAYGWKVGTRRILELLDRYGIKATFFVPGLVIEQRWQLCEEILKRGHEIGHHSWSHAWIISLTPEQEREEMERGIEIIQRLTGRGPAGWRSPAAELSPITLPGRTLQPPSAALGPWSAELDTLDRDDRAFTLAMHPRIIGRGSPLVALDGLIQHILDHPRVWFACCDQVAEAIRPRLRATAQESAA